MQSAEPADAMVWPREEDKEEEDKEDDLAALLEDFLQVKNVSQGSSHPAQRC